MKDYLFLRRPILAAVISAFILIMGTMGMQSLPVAQYPDLVPPSVSVSAYFPGASPEVIAELVADPLEEALNGLTDMWYMESTSSASGMMSLTVTFELGVDSETAANRVNLKVQSTLSSLPSEVQRTGVSVSSGSGSFLQIVTLASPDGRYDSLFLNNYTTANVLEALQRVPGVASASSLISEEYSMRIWYDPGKLAALGLSTQDLASAVEEQNAQYAAGTLGMEPAPSEAGMTWLTSTQGRYETAEEFENIIIRVGENGAVTRLGDVARVVLGAADYSVKSRLNGQPVAGVSISLSSGANALETAAGIKSAMEELSRNFPPGVEYDIPYDVTTFVELSIEEVVKTLFEAIVLVALVIFIFLHSVRVTVIPCLAVPVAIVGTFCGFYLLGFSINLLTLFGLVLSIGIVVDDAIVVLENAERLMQERNLAPREATAEAMGEVAGPVIAIVLVLAAVFIPVSFMGGMTGEMFRQFGITIALSVAISGLVALTLTPVMCARLLTTESHTNAFFQVLEKGFQKVTEGYLSLVRFFLEKPKYSLFVLLIAAGLTALLFVKVPQGLIPDEDQGYIIAAAQLKEGSSMPRTDAALESLRLAMEEEPAVDKILTIAGEDILGGAGTLGNSGAAFIMLKTWDERPGDDQTSFAIASKVFALNSKIADGQLAAFNPPSIVGMGTVGGLEGYLQNSTGASLEEMAVMCEKLTQAAAARPELVGVSCSLSLDTPTIEVVLDTDKAKMMRVSPADVYQALSTGLSGQYVNDFTMNGRVYEVTMQAETRFRALPEDLDNFFVKSEDGTMVSLANLTRKLVSSGPVSISRFNGLTAAPISGQAGSGYGNTEAMNALEEVAAEHLGSGYSISWSGTSFQEQMGGGTNYSILLLALVLVFMILAVQYESLALPLAALLSVPFAVLGALFTVYLLDYDNDVYVQVALVTLIGLAVKNAILIVEFAWAEYQKGASAFDAAYKAASMRFRPIVMTSLAFILGCLPMALATGASAASRNVLGSSIVGGMIAATVIGPVLIPAFFTLFLKKD